MLRVKDLLPWNLFSSYIDKIIFWKYPKLFQNNTTELSVEFLKHLCNNVVFPLKHTHTQPKCLEEKVLKTKIWSLFELNFKFIGWGTIYKSFKSQGMWFNHWYGWYAEGIIRNYVRSLRWKLSKESQIFPVFLANFSILVTRH